MAPDQRAGSGSGSACGAELRTAARPAATGSNISDRAATVVPRSSASAPPTVDRTTWVSVSAVARTVKQDARSLVGSRGARAAEAGAIAVKLIEATTNPPAVKTGLRVLKSRAPTDAGPAEHHAAMRSRCSGGRVVRIATVNKRSKAA